MSYSIGSNETIAIAIAVLAVLVLLYALSFRPDYPMPVRRRLRGGIDIVANRQALVPLWWMPRRVERALVRRLREQVEAVLAVCRDGGQPGSGEPSPRPPAQRPDSAL